MTPWLQELFFRVFPPMLFDGQPGYPILVRSVGAFIVAFFCVFLMGRRTAAWLYRRGVRDRVRDYDEFFGRSKSGTPTMGGLLIVLAITAAALVFNDLRSPVASLLLLAALWFGGLGAVDDFLKVRHQSSDLGLSRSLKMLLQAGFAVVVAAFVCVDGLSPFSEATRTALFLPLPGLFGTDRIDLGLLYPVLCVFAIVAIANAINFADGLDGLAVLPCALTTAVFGFFAYLDLITAAISSKGAGLGCIVC